MKAQVLEDCVSHSKEFKLNPEAMKNSGRIFNRKNDMTKYIFQEVHAGSSMEIKDDQNWSQGGQFTGCSSDAGQGY